MVDIEKFKEAVKKILIGQSYDDNGDIYITDAKDKKDAEIMADTNNWCCVHTTSYMPLQDKKGNIIIPSTAMATGGNIARNTVHFTLNHIVESHNDGNWDDLPYVIFVKYNDVVKNNGEPVGISLVDTYFSTDIDTGLVLPKESTYFIHPANITDTGLYRIGENEAVYKSCDFTADETKAILAMLSPEEYNEYNRLMKGELEIPEVRQVLGNDKRAEQLYKQVKSKGEVARKAFLSGIMADKRDLILVSFLRNFVTRLVMKEKGFCYIEKALDRAGGRKYTAESSVAKVIEDIAIEKRVPTGTGAHYFSAYGHIGLQGAFEKFNRDVDEIINENNMDKLFLKICGMRNGLTTKWAFDVITKNIMPNNYYDVVYEQAFDAFKHSRMEEYERSGAEYKKRYGYEQKDIQKFQTIEDFDPKLSKTLRKHVEVQCGKLTGWRKRMEHNQRFQKLKKKLDDYEQGNFEDYEEFMKPSIDIDNIVINTSQFGSRDI